MKLILHADDFGMNAAVSNGIIQAFSAGLLTSTSLLANAPYAAEAIESWKLLEQRLHKRELPSYDRRQALGDTSSPFDLGVHLNLTQGRPLTANYPAQLLDTQGCFPGIFGLYGRLLRGGNRWNTAIEAELDRQIDFLKSHSIRPTHLNGHQYCEMLPGVREIIPKLFAKHSIGAVRIAVEWHWQKSLFWQRLGPITWLLGGLKQMYARRFLTLMKPLGLKSPDAFFGTMLAGRIGLANIKALLERSQACESAEIGLHPATAAENRTPGDGWHDPLAAVRPFELEMLESQALYDLLVSRGVTLGRLA